MTIERIITIGTAVAAIAGWFFAYHGNFATDDMVNALHTETTAQGATLLLTMKNIQRGRLASYESVPEDELSEREKRDKMIIQYDLKNIETIEQSVGLSTPPE